MIVGSNKMSVQNNFELLKLEEGIDSVHLMPCKNGLFRKSLGKLLPDQLVGQINNYQQNNYYGYDLWEVIDNISGLLNKRQSKQEEVQYQNFIKSLKRFRTSGRNIDQLFDEASKASTQNIYNLVDENLYSTGFDSNFINLCERLVFILYVYLFSSILIEGKNIKNEEEVRDDINKILDYLLDVYEDLLFTKITNRQSGRSLQSSISESFYARILTDGNCDTALIDSFAQIDRRFNNGYEVINEIIKDRLTNRSNIERKNYNSDQCLKLFFSEVTFTQNNQSYNQNILENILKLRDVIADLIQLKSMRYSFNNTEDFIVDEYHQSLLSLNHKK